MALGDLFLAFIAACFADLRGNEKTRGFTRTAFVLVVLVEFGFTVSTVSSAVTAIQGIL